MGAGGGIPAPPASFRVLNLISGGLARFSPDNVVLMGDFNLVPDSGLDRSSVGGTARHDLANWADTYGLVDVWRWKTLRPKLLHATQPRIDHSLV